MDQERPSSPSGTPNESGQVEAAVARLTELDAVGPEAAVEVYEDIHRSLSAALEGDAEPPRPVEN